MAHLDIALFGYPAIEVDGAPAVVNERKAIALLAYLAMHEVPQSREVVGALLWPEHDPVQSYANLRHALWALRQAGLAAWLDTGRDTIALRGSYGLDVAAFRQALQAGQLAEAAAFYRGDFLAGFTLRDAPAFDEWQFFQAEQLCQSLAVVLQQLVVEYRERGDYQQAIDYARRWLALDSLHEPAHRQLMQLYAWAGQHAAALRQYQECERLLGREIGSDPEEETTALFVAIKAGKLVPERGVASAAPSNLPHQLTSFIGREQEIAEVKQLLGASTARLVTLTGSGGCGKTRLALQVGGELKPHYPQGIWLVELAPLADPALVPQTVAAALDLRDEPGRPILATLLDYLRARNILLILDNCEHLIATCAELAESLLHACADVQLLATSRETLGVAGEIAFRVPSLSIPGPHQLPSSEAVLRYESVRLFADRAATAMSGFAVTGDNAAAIAHVCRRLDGIPLAIELAAARVTMLRVEQIAARLADSFDLLANGSRTALPRQQTLRATIDWSYALLSAPERALLRRLSVFAGGWTLEAAEAVCAGAVHDAISPHHVFGLLTQLVNKSLVVVEREQGEEARYHLLETIRQYVGEKLREAGEEASIRDRHLTWFADLAERAEPDLAGPRYTVWLGRLDDDLDNIRAALAWSCAPRSEPGAEQALQAGLRLASALMHYWEARSPLCQGSDWLEHLLDQPGAVARTPARAKALAALIYLKIIQGEAAVELQLLTDESLALYRELSDEKGAAFASFLSAILLGLRDDDAAWHLRLTECVALYRRIGDTFGIAEVLGWLGFFEMNLDYTRAHAYLEESVALFRALGHVGKMSVQLAQLGVLALRHRKYAAARVWLTESLEVERGLGLPGVVDRIGTLGELALRQGDYEQARIYLEESVVLSRETGRTTHNLWSLVRLGYVALRQGDETRARLLFAECQQKFKDAGNKIGVVYTLEGMASMLTQQGQPTRAVRLFAWADAAREAIADRRPPVEQADVDRDIDHIRTQLEETAIAAAQAEGRAMSLEQAVAEALD